VEHTGNTLRRTGHGKTFSMELLDRGGVTLIDVGEE